MVQAMILYCRPRWFRLRPVRLTRVRMYSLPPLGAHESMQPGTPCGASTQISPWDEDEQDDVVVILLLL